MRANASREYSRTSPTLATALSGQGYDSGRTGVNQPQAGAKDHAEAWPTGQGGAMSGNAQTAPGIG